MQSGIEPFDAICEFTAFRKMFVFRDLELTAAALLCGQVSVDVSAGGGRVDCEQ